jgi:5-methylcytosine-specific restriction endonuclease McrBC regulatory subunit McrC
MTAASRVEYLDVPERSECELVNERHIGAFRSAGLEFEQRQYFTLKIRGSKYFVTAGKYIGVIPITSDLALRIRAKLPTGRLVRLLSIAHELPILTRLTERYYEHGEDCDVMELLLLAFHRELSVLFQLGPYRQYASRHGSGQYIKGRLQPGKTVLTLWPRGLFDKAAFQYFELSADNPLSRALEYTLWYVMRVYAQVVNSPRAEVLRDFDDAHKLFAAVPQDRSRSFLPDLRQHLREDTTSEPLATFHSLLSVCRMIIEDVRVDIEESTTVNSMSLLPMVINMEAVFQSFILHVVGERSGDTNGLECWDTSAERQRKLFSVPQATIPSGFQMTSSSELAKPDFTVAINGKPILICDAKYKKSYHASDIYQAVAHAMAYGTEDVLLIYPAVDSTDEVRFTSKGEIGDVSVFTCSFPLNATDLRSASDALFEGIQKILRSRLSTMVAAF